MIMIRKINNLSKRVLTVGILAWLAACGPAAEPAAASGSGLRVIVDDPSDTPLRHLTQLWKERFRAGDAGFEQLFREVDGLGPLYIRPSCASCHTKDGKGPGSVTKMALPDATYEARAAALPFGGTVRGSLAAGATQPVLPPERPDLVTSRRIGPAVFGRGYLEAIRDADIYEQERLQARRSDGVHGHINWVVRVSETNDDELFHHFGRGQGPLIGRFGVKARLATIDDFVADAYQGDMGITSPLRPTEMANPDHLTDDAKPGLDIDLNTVNVVADYVRLIDIPKRTLPTGGGQATFARIGCATCHVPEMTTRDDYPIAPLAGIAAPVYTDLLLHNMGSDLADGMIEFDAGGADWRTAPLIGLRHMTSYLHDGRATTLDQAIHMHRGPGSQANRCVDAFDALTPEAQQALINFVQAL